MPKIIDTSKITQQKRHNDTMNRIIKRSEKEHLIKDQVADGFITQNPKTPRSSKIHDEEISGRPVISLVNFYR